MILSDHVVILWVSNLCGRTINLQIRWFVYMINSLKQVFAQWYLLFYNRKGPWKVDLIIQNLFLHIIEGGNGVICQQSDLSPFVILIYSKISIHCYKSKLVMYWIVNWPYLWSALRYQAEIFTQHRHEPGASFKL